MGWVSVNNGESTPSGRKRHRWELRDEHGHLVEATEWAKCAHQNMPCRDVLAALPPPVDIGQPRGAARPALRDRSVEPGDPRRPDIARAARDMAGT